MAIRDTHHIWLSDSIQFYQNSVSWFCNVSINRYSPTLNWKNWNCSQFWTRSISLQSISNCECGLCSKLFCYRLINSPLKLVLINQSRDFSQPFYDSYLQLVTITLANQPTAWWFLFNTFKLFSSDVIISLYQLDTIFSMATSSVSSVLIGWAGPMKSLFSSLYVNWRPLRPERKYPNCLRQQVLRKLWNHMDEEWKTKVVLCKNNVMKVENCQKFWQFSSKTKCYKEYCYYDINMNALRVSVMPSVDFI